MRFPAKSDIVDNASTGNRDTRRYGHSFLHVFTVTMWSGGVNQPDKGGIADFRLQILDCQSLAQRLQIHSQI
jgi:hypothetical protein